MKAQITRTMNQTTGNIIELAKKNQGILMNQTNCNHEIASQLTADLCAKWPDYLEYIKTNTPDLGMTSLRRFTNAANPASNAGEITVATLYTHYRPTGKLRLLNYGALAHSLERLQLLIQPAAGCNQFAWRQMYVPYKSGCGLPGGDWDIVQEMFAYYFPATIIVNPL